MTGSAIRSRIVKRHTGPLAVVQQLQNSVGNHATQSLLAGGLLQPKLRIGPVNDVYEREADQTADRVMRMPDPASDAAQPLQAPISPVQRMCADCEEEEEKEKGPVQRKQRSSGESAVSANDDSRISSLRGGGRPLSPAACSFFEPRFGHEFSDVRVHTGPSAAGAAAAINARAFTLGRDIVFGAGEYAPQSTNGGRLVAHELTHVLQQRGATSGSPVLQREEKKKTPKKKKRKLAPGTAKDTAELKLSLTKKSPCACLVFVHNDERNARRTAELMHQHCAFNFASVQQKVGREIPLPRHASTQDPNELFPRHIAEECTQNEARCRDFLTNNEQSTKPQTIKRYAQIQYFLAIKDCSNDFHLPVVSLHNDRIGDTATFRDELKKKQPKKGSTDPKEVKKGQKLDALLEKLKVDVDKTGAGTKDPKSLADLKKVLRDEFKATDTSSLYGQARKTNIFRWCEATDLVECHVGNPTQPDTVVWATNASDFATLREKDVNVVLQDKPGKTKIRGGESETDLSTEDIYDQQTKDFAKLVLQSVPQALLDLQRVQALSTATPVEVMAKVARQLVLQRELRELLMLYLKTLKFGTGDFATLSKKDVNQKKPGKSQTRGGESDTDLSTLFLFMEDIYDQQTNDFAKLVLQSMQQTLLDLIQVHALSPTNRVEVMAKVFREIVLQRKLRELLMLYLKTLKFGRGRVAALRYVNIETPGVSFDATQADSNFDFINEILDGLGINCCDAEGKKKVKEGLAATP